MFLLIWVYLITAAKRKLHTPTLVTVSFRQPNKCKGVSRLGSDFTCISLMTRILNTFSCIYWPFVIFLVKCLFCPFTHFSKTFVFYC